jgi:hypothetical protein
MLEMIDEVFERAEELNIASARRVGCLAIAFVCGRRETESEFIMVPFCTRLPYCGALACSIFLPRVLGVRVPGSRERDPVSPFWREAALGIQQQAPKPAPVPALASHPSSAPHHAPRLYPARHTSNPRQQKLLPYLMTMNTSSMIRLTWRTQIWKNQTNEMAPTRPASTIPFVRSAIRCMDGLIDYAEGRNLAKHRGCTDFMETSAKHFNVDEAFRSLVREIRKHNEVRLSQVDIERG